MKRFLGNLAKEFFFKIRPVMPVHGLLHICGVFYMRLAPHSLKLPEIIRRFKIPKLEQVIAEEGFPVNTGTWRFAGDSVRPPFHSERFRLFYVGGARGLIG